MKTSATTRKYRPAGSRKPVALDTFRQQMADYARAERLRELRDATHLSREKVAGEVGVTTKTLYAWENGGSIRWENAKRLAAFYGVAAEDLVSRELVDTGDIRVPPAEQPEWARRLEDKVDALLTAMEITLADEDRDAAAPAAPASARGPGRRRRAA